MAEVYISAYLAIEVDAQKERTFLNNLAIALDLPKGLQTPLKTAQTLREIILAELSRSP